MRKETYHLRALLFTGLCFLAAMAKGQQPPVVKMASIRPLIGQEKLVTVRGQVLFETAPGFLFLADDTGHVRAIATKPIPLNQGDVVEVTGVPEKRADHSWLSQATVTRISEGVMPNALRLSGVQVADHDAEYITTTVKVLEQTTHSSNYLVNGERYLLTLDVLLVEADGAQLKIMCHEGVGAHWRYPVGTIAEFTGVVRGRGEFGESESFETHVLVNSADDVKVISKPPFWTTRAFRVLLAWIALAALLAAGLFAVWFVLHRHRLKQMKRAEEQLRQANAMLEKRVAERTEELQVALAQQTELARLKTDFVSLVTHEFRTPLGVIMSASDVLKRYFDRLTPEKRERHLDMILRSTQNLAALIDEVLLLGRVEEGQMQFSPTELDIEKLCNSLCDEVRSASKGAGNIEFKMIGPLDGAVSDEALLRHIVSNLLSNAIKYSEPGSVVEFTADRLGNDLVLVVRDRGIGIPAEDQERLFNTFTRASNVGNRLGTGLGLVVVQRCVRMHGGTLRLESTVGEGTTVTVQLPAFDSRISNPE